MKAQMTSSVSSQPASRLQTRSIHSHFALITAAMLIVATCLGSTAVSQDAATAGAVKTDPISADYIPPVFTGDESRAEKSVKRAKTTAIKRHITTLKKTLKNEFEAGNTGNGELKKYLDEYIFARMTQTDPMYISNLGELRREFLKEFLHADYPTATRQVIIEQHTIPKMQQIIDGNYHKGVQMNAVVLLGLLNDVEGSTKILPIPSQKAWDALQTILNDPAKPAHLVVGALAGIQRHVSINRHRRALGNIGPTKTKCLAIANGTAAGQKDWDKDLNYWMQRRAIQTLGATGQAQPGVSDALTLILNDKEKTYWLRLDALIALSKLDNSSIPPAQVEPIVKSVSRFLAESLETEATRLDKNIQDLVFINILYGDKDILLSGSAKGNQRDDGPGSAMGFGEGGGGGGGGDKADEKPQVNLPTYQLNDSRRRVKVVLQIGRTLLRFKKSTTDSLYGIAPADKQEAIGDFVDAVDELLKKTNVGIKNLSKEDEEDAEKDEESITRQLADIYRSGSQKLSGLIEEDEPATDEFAIPAKEDDAKAKTQEAPGKPGDDK